MRSIDVFKTSEARQVVVLAVVPSCVPRCGDDAAHSVPVCAHYPIVNNYLRHRYMYMHASCVAGYY